MVTGCSCPLASGILYAIRHARWFQYRTKLQQAAVLLGLREASNPERSDGPVPVRERPRHTRHQRIIAEGSVQGREVLLLSLRYLADRINGIDLHQNVFAFALAESKIPAFALESRPLDERHGVDLDSDSYFSKKYRLTGQDESAIRQFLSSDVRDKLETARIGSVECDGRWILIGSRGQVPTDELERFFEESKRVFDIFANRFSQYSLKPQ